MRCLHCGEEKTEDVTVNIGEHNALVKVCSNCKKIIDVDCGIRFECNENAKKYFKEEYKYREYEKLHDELQNKYLVIDIIKVRHELECTIKDLSYITGISEASIGKIEKGIINTNMLNVFKIAYALNCTVDQIAYWIDKSQYDREKHIIIIP